MGYMKEEFSIIRKVDIFIDRLDNLDYTIKPEATEIYYSSPSVTPSMPKKQKRLIDYLANAISKYQENKDNERYRLSYAKTLLWWINRAIVNGVIQEGKGLISKNKELERDNKRLRERLDECNERCQRLEEEIERIHNYFPDTRTFTGDVQGE